MKKIILSVFFLLFIQVSVAQKTYVVSFDDKKAIPFANVIYMINDSIIGGTYCNENGFVEITNSKLNFVKMSSVGYVESKISKNEITDTIFLKELDIELSEITLNSHKRQKKKPKLYRLGHPIKYKGFSFDVSNGFEMVAFVENPFQENKKIKSFLIRTVKFQNVSTIFRVLFYTNNNGVPDKPIIKKGKNTIFTSNPRQEKIRLDVSGMNIILPKEGIFIGIEYIGIADEDSSKDVNDENNRFDVHTTISFVKSKDKNAPHIFSKNQYSSNKTAWYNVQAYKNIHFPHLKENEYYVPAFGIEVYE